MHRALRVVLCGVFVALGCDGPGLADGGADAGGMLPMDNFEWAEGYEPRFGLYRVDRTGEYARVPTEGATRFSTVAGARTLTIEQREEYGGLGPMTPEE